MDGGQGPGAGPDPFYAQYASIKPWIRTQTPAPSDRSACSRLKSVKAHGFYECILCACCSTRLPSYWWNGDRYLGPGRTAAGLPLDRRQRDEDTNERLDDLEDPFKLYRCHTILNCTRTCPKGLNPALAIARSRN